MEAIYQKLQATKQSCESYASFTPFTFNLNDIKKNLVSHKTLLTKAVGFEI
jgi:hypothetical protein